MRWDGSDLGPWDDGDFALVACIQGRTLSFIHGPGRRSDEQLRAQVNAAADAVVVRSVPPVLDMASMTWRCDVCRDERPDARISVAQWHVRGLESQFPDCCFHLKYCNDRADCVSVAVAGGVWPQDLPDRRPPVAPEHAACKQNTEEEAAGAAAAEQRRGPDGRVP